MSKPWVPSHARAPSKALPRVANNTLFAMIMENEGKRRAKSKETSARPLMAKSTKLPASKVDLAEKTESSLPPTAEPKKPKPTLVRKITIDGPPKLSKEDSLNLHNNFRDLNPDYDIRKFNRVKAIQRYYENKIGAALIQKVEV